jgi:bifunctional non-homologous end joining protein LigD
MTKENPIFVVHKHAASHLHYDFRLEVDGVLKSWAVPKGPSLDPSVKHLAIMVDDHEFSYRGFEGVISEGSYGAGVVMVWDQGSYTPVGDDFRGGLVSGKIHFILHGIKLKGEFYLIRTTLGKKGDQWLLMKKKDEYATSNDVLEKDLSVKTGRTMKQIEVYG